MIVHACTAQQLWEFLVYDGGAMVEKKTYKIVEGRAVGTVYAHEITRVCGILMKICVVCVVAGDDDALLCALFCELHLAVLVLALLDALLAGLGVGRGVDGEVSEGATCGVDLFLHAARVAVRLLAVEGGAEVRVVEGGVEMSASRPSFCSSSSC